MWQVGMTRKVKTTECWVSPLRSLGPLCGPSHFSLRCTDPVPDAPLKGTNPLKTRPIPPQSSTFTGFAKLARPLQ